MKKLIAWIILSICICLTVSFLVFLSIVAFDFVLTNIVLPILITLIVIWAFRVVLDE